MCDTLADGMANGEYDPKTGRIKIALDAEENAYLRTAGHELYHYIEDWNPTAAGELREYVIGKLKESENYDYEGRVKELQKLYEAFRKSGHRGGNRCREHVRCIRRENYQRAC